MRSCAGVAMKATASCFGGAAMAILLVIWCCVSVTPGDSASRMRLDREHSEEMISGETDSSNCSPDLIGEPFLQPFPAKSTLRDGRRSQHLPLLISGEAANPRNRFTEHLQLLLGWIFAPRRQLDDESSPSTPTPAPASAPAPAPASASAPAPASASAPATSPSLPPELSPDFPPLYEDYPTDSPEPDIEIRRKPPQIPKNSDGTRIALIITISLAAAGSLILLAVIFIHCCNGSEGNSWSRHRDEKPLLALSSSIFSNGSSSKSLELKDYSMNRERTESESPSFERRVSEDTKESNFAVETAATSAVDPERETPAKPPPPPPLMPSPAKKPGFPPNLPLPPLKNRPNPGPPLPPKGSSSSRTNAASGPKTKLKPLFWDKVLTNPDQSMIWHQISSGSFQFNEEMIENLFGYSASKQKSGDDKKAAAFDSPQQIQLLEPKKAQNLAILLRALNVTVEEVRDALMEGSELPAEVLQTLIKMAPTADEELKLRLYDGETSGLGPAERFLKALVDIPFAFKRMDAMLLMSSMEEEISSITQDLQTIEAACEELKSSRLFKKLLEAVVKIGNRMNDGTYRGGAQAFKLDTLLKLADVKSSDTSTTLLHFLVHQLILSEGRRGTGTPPPSPATLRRRGLAALSALPSDLRHVRAASFLDPAAISGGAAALRRALDSTRTFVTEEGSDLGAFCEKVRGYVAEKEKEVEGVREEERRVGEMVKRTTDFFHGEAGKDEGLRLFVVVREFMGMLERACREVAAEEGRPQGRGAATAGEEWRRRRGEWSASASEDEGSP